VSRSSTSRSGWWRRVLLVEVPLAIFGVLFVSASALVVINWKGPPVCRAESPAENAASNLGILRQAVHLYAIQHNDTLPSDPARQLTESTDATGQPGEKYGPYLRMGILRNALGTSPDIRLVETMPAVPRGTYGWIYALDTGEIRADVTGCLPDGTRIFDL